MTINEKIRELEFEIERLKQIKSVDISDEDMKIIKFIVENNAEIKYLYFDIFKDYYMIKFYNKNKKQVAAVRYNNICQSVVDDWRNYDIDLILGG